MFVGRRNADHAAVRADRNSAPVDIVSDSLNAGNGACAQKRQHGLPIIGRPIGETDRQRAGFALGAVAEMPQRRRRTPEHLQKSFVEPADAVEARRQRDLGHRQRCLVNQLLGQQHPPRLRHRDRRRPDMLAEQPPQLSRADAEPVGKALDISLVEAAGFDQGERARHGVAGAAPEREIGRCFRPAAQAWAKAGLLGRRRGRIERYILEFRGAGGANRPAVDAGGFDAHEQPAIEAGITGRDGAVAGGAVHIHHRSIVHCSELVSRFSDIIHGCLVVGNPRHPTRRAALNTDAPGETRAAPSALKNQARGCAMGEQTPIVICDPSFGGANAPAPAQHNSLRLDHSCLSVVMTLFSSVRSKA